MGDQAGELADPSSLLSEHFLGVCGADDDVGHSRGDTHFDTGVALLRQFTLEELVQLGVEDTIGHELATLRDVDTAHCLSGSLGRHIGGAVVSSRMRKRSVFWPDVLRKLIAAAAPAALPPDLIQHLHKTLLAHDQRFANANVLPIACSFNLHRGQQPVQHVRLFVGGVAAAAAASIGRTRIGLTL